MSLDHHPGFDTGGMLWSLNLTEYPQGTLGAVFPLCIAGLHFANVQLSLRNSTLQHVPGTLTLLAKIYKVYLQLLTLPILITTFYVPQGSLIYWFTNSTFSLLQLLCLRNPNLLRYLGLPEMNASAIAPTAIQRDSSVAAETLIRTKEGEMSAQTLSPEDLVSLSVEILGGGQKHAAIALLRVALDKDPGNVRALLILGQTLLQKEHHAEAAEFLEKAISKLLFTGNPTEVGEVDLLILSSQWAGIANMLQGKMEEGFVHLERIAQMNEPQDSNSKAHYYDGLIILSIALANVNRRAEALHYLHKAAAYNPAFNRYIEQLEVDARGFASHLSDSKRYL
ncbi:ALBINO3-like protein 3, mitochondrial isoform X3 [Salvia splendens]|nr:ALBINO3-like protein 3, mitochondrial isoform X3 [Salvia splendens]